MKEWSILQRNRPEEIKLSLAPLVFVALNLGIQIWRDFQNPTSMTATAMIIGLRMMGIAGIVMILAMLLGNWDEKKYKILILGVLVNNLILLVVSSFFRVNQGPLEYMVTVVGIAYIYFLIPLPVLVKITAGLSYSVVLGVAILVSYQRSVDSAGTLLYALALLNGMGLLNASQFHVLRKRRSEAMKNQEKEIHLRELLEIPCFEGIMIVDHGLIKDCNARLCELTNHQPGNVHNKPAASILGIDRAILEGMIPDHPVLVTIQALYENIQVEIMKKPLSPGNDLYGLIVRQTLAHDRKDTEEIPDGLAAKIPFLPLTKREKEIAVHILDGSQRNEIAERLFISEETVKKHTANIYRKLGVNSKMDLVRTMMNH